jgi:hypothetical protein
VAGIARCGDAGFLVDPRRAMVYRVDLPSGTVKGRIGGGELLEPAVVAADCEADRLYVVDSRTVFAYRMSNGASVTRYKLPPRTFYSGSFPALSGDGRVLFLSALWAPADHNTNSLDAFFLGHKLGLRLSLDDGTTAPLVNPIKIGCRSPSWSCGQISVAVTGGSRDGRLIVSQGQSRDILVSRLGGGEGVLVDIGSPLFRSDGTMLPRGADFGAKSRWDAENSYVDSVMVFGRTIATVHVRERAPSGDDPSTRFTVLMNLHSLEGARLACDIGLPDVPRGRDRESLYVADYEPEGRSSAVTKVDIVRIIPGARSFRVR